MGLAGRKIKQRIGADPRNLTWSDDSSKFGAKYLKSLGWTNGTGLGVSGEGSTSNLKIHQKLDLMGIGANRHGPNGDVAGWKGGREFEGLLARLNQTQNLDSQDLPVAEERVADNDDSAVDQSTNATEPMMPAKESVAQLSISGKKARRRRKGNADEKKRKRSATEDAEVDATESKRGRQEEERDKNARRKARKAAKKLKTNQNTKSEPGNQVAGAGNVSNPVKDTEVVKVAPRYRAHRARNIASKRMAAASPTGMNEILGISSPAATVLKIETSSIQFPTLSSPPPLHPVHGDESQTGPPQLGLPHDLEQTTKANETDTPTLSLGSPSAYGRGLGFRGPSEYATNTPQESATNDQLRRSGKSVAEYFSEKMRMKGMAKNLDARQ